MATNITGKRQQFYVEDVNYGVSVSQALAKKLAAGVQFINDYQIMRLNFGAAGSYYTTTLPVNDLGLSEIIEFDSEIVNCWVSNGISGTSGTTEGDLKVKTLGGGSWNTIFSTTPKFTSASANDAIVDASGKIVTPPTGVTRPVFSSVNLNAGDRIRFDLITCMTGGADFYINLHLKPR